MTFLYDARYSIVLLRPKNEVKLLHQSAEKSICMGKWPVSNWGEFFRHVVVVGLELELANQTRLLPNCSADVVLSRTDEGAGAKNRKLESRGPIFAEFRSFEPSF